MPHAPPRRRYGILALLGSLVLAAAGPTPAQGGGARAGLGPGGAPPGAAALDHHAVEHYITIEGSAEIRVKPSVIRVVLAVITEGVTPLEAQQRSEERQTALRGALRELGLDDAHVAIDFISMLPAYRWETVTRENQAVAVEKLAGYVAQSNVHVRAGAEDQALAVVRSAFRLGLPDIIAFDYWAPGLDRVKADARAAALAEARAKADLLLALFPERPAPINVHEETLVLHPSDLYASFENAYEEQYRQHPFSDRSIPTIRAARPRNTFYRGFGERVDRQDPEPVFHPAISVVSRVRCYYASPGAGRGEHPAPSSKS